jgi:hypothetical protein
MVYGTPYFAFTSSQKESKFPSANGLFGGYAATTLPGIRVMNSDMLERMRAGDPDIPTDDYELAVVDPGAGEVILEHQTRGVQLPSRKATSSPRAPTVAAVTAMCSSATRRRCFVTC